MQQLPIVTVTFRGDFRLTVLQALSIDRLFEVAQISDYTLILNTPESDFFRLREEFSEIFDLVLSKELRSKIRYLRWEDFFPTESRIGFYDQQILKLAVSRSISEKYYLLLDGKNHFTSKCSFDSFFVNGLPIAETVATSEYWRGNLDGSLSMIGVSNPNRFSGRMFPSITPFVMYSSLVREMIHLLESKYESDLPSILKGKEGSATEFLLYYSYLCEKELLNLYYEKKTPVNTLFVIWPQDMQNIRRMVEECKNGQVPMFGLHRKRIPSMSSEETNLVAGLWKSNLLLPWENIDWFLQS